MTHKIFLCLIVVLLLSASTAAQTTSSSQTKVNIIIDRAAIRFAPQETALGLRFVVTNQAGAELYDSGQLSGSPLDWPLRDNRGEAVKDGLYFYTLSIKDRAGELSQQRGYLIVNRAADAERVYIATSERVGIGTTPQSERLEVEGNIKLIGTGNGVIFPDGTKQTTAAVGSGITAVTASAPLASSGGTTPNLSLTGTIGTNNGGTGLSSGPTAAGQYLRSTGAGNWGVGSIAANDLPSLPYVAKTGDTMTGALILPADGLIVGGNQLVLAGGKVGIGTANPSLNYALQADGGTNRNAVYGRTGSSTGFGVEGVNDSGAQTGSGVRGSSLTGTGVSGFSNSYVGVEGSSTTNFGVVGTTGGTTEAAGVSGTSTGLDGNGVIGEANNGSSAFGVWGLSDSGYAGNFSGDVRVLGILSKSGGSFKIDHPLDPANKYLSHSFVESPDMLNIYNGNVTTDAAGDATVTLPEYFAALNRDFRYQLTVIGQFAQAIVADEIKDNRFKIKTDKPNVKVSWQVTGIRQDAWANAHRIQVEENKPEKERGTYLHPRVLGQPEEKGIEWAQRPELMRQIKERREKAQKEKSGQRN